MIESIAYERIRNAADYILSRLDFVPDTGIVLGTGCSALADRVEDKVVIDYADIPGFLETTNPDHPGKLVCGSLAGRKVVCMNGRFHYYEGFTEQELSIPVHVLKLVGIRRLILTNASGAVNASYHPGDLMVIDDHIKLFLGSPMRGANDDRLGPRFFGVTDMYSKQLRAVAAECAQRCPLKVHEGVYMFFPGPQFETPAEIRAARILGADVVGMSTVTEALTAAHVGMPVLGIAVVTNMASGVNEEKPDGSEVVGVANGISKPFCDYIEDIVGHIADEKEDSRS